MQPPHPSRAALVKMGVAILAAHRFVFCFGVLSFLTPPVAASRVVAAGLAQAIMWRTSWSGMQLAAAGLSDAFLWVYNPALLQGSWRAVALAALTTTVAALANTMRFGLFLRGIAGPISSQKSSAKPQRAPELVIIAAPSGAGEG